jgi:hypothetical protein
MDSRMQLIQLVFVLLATAQPAPAEVNAALPPVSQQEQQIAISAPLADWEQVLYMELQDSPVYAGTLASAIKEAASETEIAPEVLWSVAFTESRGRHWHGNGKVKRGSSGEVGLMQIKPFWQKALKREYGIDIDLYNMQQNVRAGAYILSRGGSDLNVMLSYYNTGKPLRSCGYQRKVVNYLSRIDELADAKPLLSVPGISTATSQTRDAVMKPAPVQDPIRPTVQTANQPAVAQNKQDQQAGYDPHQDVIWAD